VGGCNVGQLLKIYAIRKLSENVFGENGFFSFKGRIKDFLRSLSVMFFQRKKIKKERSAYERFSVGAYSGIL
jgi:hypothetical protein